jgi:nucleoside-diphosphate-sugar epimerase
MLSGQRILITGATGMLGVPVARYLTATNEVWAAARFLEPAQRGAALGTAPAARAELEALGATTRRIDLANPDLSEIPSDFDYVLHLAHTRLGSNFPRAVQVNAVGAGLILSHCRRAKAALVMSSFAVYSSPADVFQPLREDGDIGRAFTPWAPSSPVSKVSLEAVARLCARDLDLPVVIPRLNTVYGSMGGLPIMDLDAVAAGRPVQTFADPYPHSPLHIDDLCAQIEPLLAAAHRDAVIVNWAGDEVVTQRQWCEQAGALAGRAAQLSVNAIPGTPNGVVADTEKRRSLTGPCGVRFEPAFAALFGERQRGR